jgi:glycosyltransferase involved in cell wall biosynthesis
MGLSYQKTRGAHEMRIAYFSPVSPQKTGIADYTEREILPYLSKFFDIDVFIDRKIQPTNPYLTKNFDCFSYEIFPKKAHNYDIPVYQMGNNIYHKFIYDTLLVYPGITVLHDIYLHGFFWGQSLAQGDYDRYISEFEYCYGDSGKRAALNAIHSGVYPEFSFPLIKRIIDHSLGVICHSEFGASKVFAEQPDSICAIIPQPFTIQNNPPETKARENEQIPITKEIFNKFPIVTSFGYISAHKRYDVILDTFKKFVTRYPEAVYVIIGRDDIGLSEMIRESGLEGKVIITGFVTDDIIVHLLNISDFCVNLRYPTAGETSRSVLQIMSLGKPVIVSNVGWFSELPNDACLKIDVDSYQSSILYEFFDLLSTNQKINTIIGKHAREYIKKRHDPATVAKQYHEFIKNVLNGDELIINIISKRLNDVGIYQQDTDLIRTQVKKMQTM